MTLRAAGATRRLHMLPGTPFGGMRGNTTKKTRSDLSFTRSDLVQLKSDLVFHKVRPCESAEGPADRGGALRAARPHDGQPPEQPAQPPSCPPHDGHPPRPRNRRTVHLTAAATAATTKIQAMMSCHMVSKVFTG